MKTKIKTDKTDAVIEEVVDLLSKGNAHASLDDALKNLPFALLGKKPGKLPYSIWQLAEHIRIAQWDILEFSSNVKHVSPKWPDGYWPTAEAPKSKAAWKKCIIQIVKDRNAFIDLIKKAGSNINTPFKYGDGQSLLKEALVLADHNSYHTAEIIVIRRLLGAWK